MQPLDPVSHTKNFGGQHGKGTLSNQTETPPQIWQSERLHIRYVAKLRQLEAKAAAGK